MKKEQTIWDRMERWGDKGPSTRIPHVPKFFLKQVFKKQRKAK